MPLTQSNSSDIVNAFNGFIKDSEKVVNSDFLYFLFNKINREPHDKVIETCLTFAPYTETLIQDEKLKFYSAVGEKCKSRRADKDNPDAKKTKDAEDILLMMTQRDAQGQFLPMFVSSNMNNIPWTSKGDASN